VLPRSLIASQVWDMNFTAITNVIEVAIRRLRAKIDDGFEAKLIRTVRGMGYVLERESDAARRQVHHAPPDPCFSRRYRRLFCCCWGC